MTIQAPVVAGASPSPAATPSPTGAAGAPAGSPGTTGAPTTVSGTTQTPDTSGGSGLLPRTGLQLAGLVTAALALITLGQALASWARRFRTSGAT